MSRAHLCAVTDLTYNTRFTPVAVSGGCRPALRRSRPTATGWHPLPSRYRPSIRLPKARTTKPITTSQNAKPESTGIVTRRAMTPTTATTTAIQKVICFGALSFMAYLQEGRIRDLLGSVALRRITEGLCPFASPHLSCAALDAQPGDSAAIDPGARAIPSPKKVAYQRRLWSTCQTLS